MTTRTMLNRVLIPLDGSFFAEHALLTAIALARRDEAELELVTVVLDQMPPAFLERVDRVTEHLQVGAELEGERYLDSLKARILDRVPELVVTTSVKHGGTIEGIGEEVRERGVDLVVMTSHGRGPFQRAWLGSVADGLIRHSAAPVLLLRPAAAERPPLVTRPPFERVLVPVDGSVAARRIIPDAVAVAGTDARFTLLQCVGSGTEVHAHLPATELGAGVLASDIDEIARSSLGMAESELRAVGAEHVDTVVVHGRHPEEQIVEYADLQGIDLIAMSTHGEGGIARLFLGSVSDKVARTATCPVLLHRSSSPGN